MRKQIALISMLLVSLLMAQSGPRQAYQFPDIPGYTTLLCDFHSHTVFSDGNVWPTERVSEAWQTGLDALAITDHIEYRPHKDDIVADHNRSFAIASQSLNDWPLLLIKGSEITRDLPVGHYNAIFLTDSNPLDVQNPMDAIKAAVAQGAFVFWNHPGWTQPETKAVWYPEQTQIYDKGWMNGMEIANDQEYYPEAFQWCLDKNITMLGNSDIHGPAIFPPGEHRNITLVFVEESSQKGIKDALFAGRTAVYAKNRLMGREVYLKPLYEKAILIKPAQDLTGQKVKFGIEIYNPLPFDIELTAAGSVPEVQFPEQIVLYSQRSVLLRIKVAKDKNLDGLILPFVVQNVLIAPGKGLDVGIKVN
jgi:3',5'-nucleoside bisphosphate phosphatase